MEPLSGAKFFTTPLHIENSILSSLWMLRFCGSYHGESKTVENRKEGNNFLKRFQK